LVPKKQDGEFNKPIEMMPLVHLFILTSDIMGFTS